MRRDINERETLTIAEAARVLGVGVSTAYAGARAGQFPVIRIGTRLVVPKAKLYAFLGKPANAANASSNETSNSGQNGSQET